VKPDQAEDLLPAELPARRYCLTDRNNTSWYISCSLLQGKPVEIFASTAIENDFRLQSRLTGLTAITRLLSLILQAIHLNRPLSMAQVLDQLRKSSRQPNDLPDLLARVLNDQEQNNA
jgi:hypothetical protein